MQSEENGPFKKLRDIVANYNSVDDAKENLLDAISLMSEINNLYLDISYARYEAMNQLEKAARDARQQQIRSEESLHACQLIADQNLASIPSEVNVSDIRLPSIKEFQQETGIPDEDIERLTTNELLYKRLNNEISKIPQIKEEYNNVHTTRCELTKKLDDERKIYAPIISKMQKQYDEFKGFTKRDDS